MPVPSWQPVWRFPDLDRKQVVELLEKCHLGEAVEKHLLTESIWDDDCGDEVRLYPPIKLVSELSAEARQTIYRILRQWKENPYHWSPVDRGIGNGPRLVCRFRPARENCQRDRATRLPHG